MQEPSRPDIAVVVSTYRRPDGLRRLLDGLAGQTLATDRWETVIVDNASGPPWDREIDDIAAAAPVPVRVLRTEINRGPAPARNLGWRSTSAPYLAFTDDDCVPGPSWLEAGVSALEADLTTGVVQGRTTRPGGSEDYPYTCFTVIREVLRPSPWFEGCNLFFRREAVEAAGGFDEKYGFFGEETSLGWSTLEAGWGRSWADTAIIEHELGDRPWRWHLRFHWLERQLVRLVADHPGMRDMFWRRWAVKQENALFALAVAGLLVATRRRAALALALPYATWLYPPGGKRMSAVDAAHQISVHAVSLAGKLAVGAKERTLLL